MYYKQPTDFNTKLTDCFQKLFGHICLIQNLSSTWVFKISPSQIPNAFIFHQKCLNLLLFSPMKKCLHSKPTTMVAELVLNQDFKLNLARIERFRDWHAVYKIWFRISHQGNWNLHSRGKSKEHYISSSFFEVGRKASLSITASERWRTLDN